MTAPEFASAEEIGALYRDRRLSPCEYVSDLTRRIERLDPHLNAFIHFDAETAARQAEALTAELDAGRTRGPLHGIPVAIKDIIDVEGVPTTCASHTRQNAIAADDSHVVALLRRAGAIIFGKTNTHEFACGRPSFDLPVPPARNPWNPDHHPGGSSSGSGAGVAAGLFPLALGTDTGGSVRHPASACGIVGFKPTYGAVSRRGVFPLAQTLDSIGALARTSADAALLIDAIVGVDTKEPSTTPMPWKTCAEGDTSSLKGLKIGYIRQFHTEDLVAPDDTGRLIDGAAATLAALGAEVEAVRLPPLSSFFAVNRILLSAEGFAVHADHLRTRHEDYGRLTRRALLAGAFLTAEDYVRAQKQRKRLVEAVNDAFSRYDILISASSMEAAARLDDPAETARTYTRQARTPFSVTGHPALSVMAGLSDDGLPIGVQLAGRAFEEPKLIAVTRAFEDARGLPMTPPAL
ncbi:amidase [Martelella radicis]|uniref:Indoleacetamide hydrolase n=1 Tax=Martelella radicis TaxID=1397476 RepID=A0A7W6KMQ2_9HYPH|nr:amidase [Martelella radicis]MBB4124138.1 aspartyl-tRNA(Asn)/glutamyl-tRNA(Gln) amidotransferase subunit A [Martelella radicis]